MDMEHACASGGGGAGTTEAGEQQDRLSALPDCLIHEILSSLKARQVVQTCVLSTRWRNLWRSAPCLDVDLDEFSNRNINEWEDWMDFEVFTVNLMSRRNMALLDSFRLHVTQGRKPGYDDRQRHPSGWLRRTMKQYFSSSSSWHLKRLHLCNVFLDNSFANHVGSVCRSLEDLELDACTCEITKITSHSMKNLVLNRCRWSKLYEIKSPTLKTLVVDGVADASHLWLDVFAAALTRLHLHLNYSSFTGGISLNKMPSLAKASINLQCGRNIVFKSRLLSDQVKILRSISNVTSLEWSGAGTKVLGEEPMFQEFKNLANLLLRNCVVSQNTLGFFLHTTPNLDKLILKHCMFSGYSKEIKGTPELNTSSSSECHGFDFRHENIMVEIIYKDYSTACPFAKLLSPL